MDLNKTLTTERLFLRTMRAADATNDYLAWMRDPEVNRFLESRFYLPERKQDLVRFIETVNASPDSLLLGIYLLECARHIGNIKIGPIVKTHSRAEIGYVIGDRAVWGRGYATEAITEISRFGFEELGLAKITSGVYETNKASAKALLNAGFVHEATICSHVICEGSRISSLIFGLDKPAAAGRDRV